MTDYLRPYFPVAVYALVVAMTGILLLVSSGIFGPKRRAIGKESTYECGVPLLGGSRERFSVKFYLVAILFVLFDIETVFLFPWAVIYRELGLFGLVEMLVFLGLLVAGFAYAWRRGGLDWE
jgi:NADH-quinone oxidoreductase subunit A